MATARARHRADHIRLALRVLKDLARLAAATALVVACSPALPRPAAARLVTADYVAVPFAPRPAPLEFVPPRPSAHAVWVDGTWVWRRDRYLWRYGAWVVPPPHARFAPSALVRRREDGQLFFASSRWKDVAGHPLLDRAFVTALGPAARARPRLGAKGTPASGFDEVEGGELPLGDGEVDTREVDTGQEED